MKAKTKYIDFTGGASADISDHNNLEQILESKEINTKNFVPVGIEFSYDPSSSVISIICVDKEKSTSDKEYIVSIKFESTIQDFLSLFKRVEISVFKEHLVSQEVDNEIILHSKY